MKARFLSPRQALKKLVLAFSLATALGAPMAAMAATATVTATAEFLSAITLTPTNMNFGRILYSSTTLTTATATLKTDGTMSYDGTVFTAGTGGSAAVAGAVKVTAGTTSATVDVSCSATATLANVAGTTTISVTPLKISANGAAAGGGNNCLGVGTPSTGVSNIAFAINDTYNLGGKIDGSTRAGAAFAGGIYSTTNTNGVSASVQVIYH